MNPPSPPPGAFYDRVADQFGAYATPARYTTNFPHGNPDEIFHSWLLRCSGPDRRALDVGCADGRFTLSIAGAFQQVIAIDLSTGMLSLARIAQQHQNVSNVQFLEADAHAIPFGDGTFDVIYSRRGPVDCREFARVLKLSGFFLHIGIGEQDARSLKETFCRGQGYGRWHESWLANDVSRLREAGFDVQETHDIRYTEHYYSREDLDLFLRGVPIFEEYDPTADSTLLDTYVERHRSARGIALERHRNVVACTLPA